MPRKTTTSPKAKDADLTEEQIAKAVEAEAAVVSPESNGRFEAVGTYMARLNSWLRAVVMFDTVSSPRWEYNLARTAGKDGVAIGPGLAMTMGLKPGDKVKVTLEKVQ